MHRVGHGAGRVDVPVCTRSELMAGHLTPGFRVTLPRLPLNGERGWPSQVQLRGPQRMARSENHGGSRAGRGVAEGWGPGSGLTAGAFLRKAGLIESDPVPAYVQNCS